MSKSVFPHSTSSKFSSSSLSTAHSLRQLVVISLGSVLFGISGCASTGSISPQYVAPSTYQFYNCAQLSQELQRINGYIVQAERENTGLTSTGIGVGIAAGRWGISPTISVGLGQANDSARQNKLSRLYGERDAVVQSARLQSCSFAQGMKLFGE